MFLVTGPLSGNTLPGGARFGVCGKSPLTNMFGEASCGGDFASEFRGAGWDEMVLTGASEKPVYILIQDAQGAPVICRHQLSTDTTSIETRELSITKVVDFTAKFMRAGLRNFIGRSNITQGFLDNLSTVVQGQLNFLIEGGVLIGADVNNLIQDADAPDTVLIDVTLDVPFPANYIRLTLII